MFLFRGRGKQEEEASFIVTPTIDDISSRLDNLVVASVGSGEMQCAMVVMVVKKTVEILIMKMTRHLMVGSSHRNTSSFLMRKEEENLKSSVAWRARFKVGARDFHQI